MPKDDDINGALWEDIAAILYVKGAGGPKGKLINGKYQMDGKLNGRNKYKHEKTESVIYFDQIWRLSSDSDLSTFVYSNVTGIEDELVPEELWNANDPEAHPPPIVVDEWLRRWSAVQVFRRLHPAKLASHSQTLCNMLKDAKDLVRLEAVTVLGRLVHKDLEAVCDVLIEHTKEEPKESVREACVKVIIKLDPKDLAKHAAQLVELLANDPANFVRLWAVVALSGLETEEMNKYEMDLDKTYKTDVYMPCREKAHQVLKEHRHKNGHNKEKGLL